MRVAAITMVHNESFFLPLWYRYYGGQLGPDHLYVIDHASTDGSVSAIFGNRIRIARDKFDDASRAAMVGDIHKMLLRFYDTVIYSDVDEFIVPRGKGLQEYAARRQIALPRCCGVNIVPGKDLADLDLFFPLLQQRPLAFPTHWYCKPLMASEPMHWRPGFHDCNGMAEIDPDLYLFHLKHLSPAHPAPNFMAKLYAQGIGGSLDEVDFDDVFKHRKSLGLHSVPADFLDRV